MKTAMVKKHVISQLAILLGALLLTAAAFCLGHFMTPETLVSHSYEDRVLPSEMQSILHEASLYTVNARLEGIYFCPEAEDAQLIVSVDPALTGPVRCIEFRFREPFAEDTAYTLFYPDAEGAFSESCTITGELKAGRESLFLELPANTDPSMQSFRLDIDQEYHLEDICVSPEGTEGSYVPAEHTDRKLWIALFAVDFLLLELLWFLRGERKKTLGLPKRERNGAAVLSGRRIIRDNGWYVFGVLLLLGLIAFEWKSSTEASPVLGSSRIYTGIFLLVGVLTAVLAALFWRFVLLRQEQEIPWRGIFVTVLLLLSVLYMVVFLPFLSPDEKTHYLSAYRIADWFLGKGTPAGKPQMIMRLEDYTFVSMRQVGLKGDYLRELTGQLHLFCREPGYVVRDASLATNAVFCYFPAAFGIAAARILHLSGAGCFYLSRMANVLFCTGVTAHVMKKYRFHNEALFTLACFPMMLQLTASCTYDTAAFCNVLLFTVHVMAMRSSRERISGRDLALCMVYAALLGPSKTVYLPLLFLIFLVPAEKLGDTGKKAVWYRLCVVGAGVLSLLLVSRGLRWLSSSTAVQTMLSENATGHILSWNGEEGYTFSYILTHLKEFILLCGRTVTRIGDEYFFTMLGSRLARYELTVPAVCGGLCFILFLFASNIREGKGEYRPFSGGEKVVSLVLCAGCTACIMLALTLGWTPLSSDTILGIQGRYFLPLLPALIPVLRDRHIQVEAGMRSRIVFLVTAVNLWLLVHSYGQMFFSA